MKHRIIEEAQSISADGGLSLFAATIDTINSTFKKITIDIKGFFAGYNSIIHCRDGHHCDITCTYVIK